MQFYPVRSGQPLPTAQSRRARRYRRKGTIRIWSRRESSSPTARQPQVTYGRRALRTAPARLVRSAPRHRLRHTKTLPRLWTCHSIPAAPRFAYESQAIQAGRSYGRLTWTFGNPPLPVANVCFKVLGAASGNGCRAQTVLTYARLRSTDAYHRCKMLVLLRAA